MWANEGGATGSIEEQSPVSSVLRLKAAGVITLRPEEPVRDLISALNEHRIGAVVVSRDGSRIEGIVSERDVLLALDRDGATSLGSPRPDVGRHRRGHMHRP